MKQKRIGGWHVVAVSLCGLLMAFILVKVIPRDPPTALASSPNTNPTTPDETPAEERLVDVEVVKPTAGGLEASTTLPGTVIAFESAKLFAKVPGYLKSQSVDIGDVVHRGQVLAEIDSPETVKGLEGAQAALDDARAQVAQADARIKTAEADKEAALAAITKAEAGIRHYSSAREYRTKQLDRITALYRSDSVEKRLVDEIQSDLQSAQGAEDGAVAEVASVKAQAHASDARVAQAKADAQAARAKLEVAQAAVDRAGVFVDYLKIVSPYDGIVVRRNFFRGDFIRSADQESLPLLVVDRIDEMRVIVQVPDLNVSCTRRGAPAVVTIDALPGTRFESKVARVAVGEQSETRTMRAEIDLKNDQGLLSPGMYGSATISLPSSPGAMQIPTSALVGAATDGMGTICLVRDGVVKVTKVRVGRDNGSQIEVLDGLSEDDEIVASHAAELVDGMHVTVSHRSARHRSPQRDRVRWPRPEIG